MASNIKVDIVKPTATNGSLSLKGDSGGSATANGVTINSSGNTSITGTTTISSADINGGTIDGTTIGGTTPAAGTFTTFTSTGITDGASSTALTIDVSGNVDVTGSLSSEFLVVDRDSGNSQIICRANGTGSNGGALQDEYSALDFQLRRTSDGSAATVGGVRAIAESDLTSSWPTALAFRVRRFSSDYEAMRIESNGNTRPGADNTYDLGTASYRWDDVYATNGTIQTSDINEKQDIEELSEAEQRVATAAKGLLRKYRWKSAVVEKGDDARIHFGIIAQDLKAAFEAEGLDAGRYGMFIYSEWWETEETYTDDNGVEQTRTDTYDTEEEAPEGAVKKDRMGIRYSELLAFIIAAI